MEINEIERLQAFGSSVSKLAVYFPLVPSTGKICKD